MKAFHIFIFIHSHESNYCEMTIVGFEWVLCFLFSLFSHFSCRHTTLFVLNIYCLFCSAVSCDCFFWNNFSNAFQLFVTKLDCFRSIVSKRVFLIINQHTMYKILFKYVVICGFSHLFRFSCFWNSIQNELQWNETIEILKMIIIIIKPTISQRISVKLNWV